MVLGEPVWTHLPPPAISLVLWTRLGVVSPSFGTTWVSTLPKVSVENTLSPWQLPCVYLLSPFIMPSPEPHILTWNIWSPFQKVLCGLSNHFISPSFVLFWIRVLHVAYVRLAFSSLLNLPSSPLHPALTLLILTTRCSQCILLLLKLSSALILMFFSWISFIHQKMLVK